MGFVSGAMVFFVIWWIVLFIVLPFGIHAEDNPKKGFATSAPKNPKLKKKFLITTTLTTFIWGIIQYLMVNHLVSFS
jgi:predicted secreted protein